MAEEYGVELSRASWKDADAPDGTPVEIKAAMHEHADGPPGNFKIYREYHEKLQQNSGVYLFAAYRVRGRGVQVLAHGRRRASRLPTMRWHGGGDHRGTEQAKISIQAVL
ncbi:hypothetical protein [Halobacterium sp. R2-5]|uniref:hypothetical protein n=1 Tax=Halobacterium sp. R2-5 TaxID=2715751 RepID=UPI00141EFDC4|nr:hypothetical protein [Halobacterium sp. R2-5]NIC01083.1 hypothetical protein [Halobacterium sp. R2-5]